MKRARALSFALALVAIVAGVSCGDPVTIATEPPAPDQSLIGGLLGGTGLLSCSALPYDSVTQVIGPAGGSITVGPHRLVVPAGALASNTRITAVAPSGTVNLVQFKPEGLQFAKAASLTLSYANCNLLGRLVPKRIAYTNDHLVILEYILSLDILNLRQVTGQVKHFSGYAVAW